MKIADYIEIIKSVCLCTVTVAVTAVMFKLYTTLNKVEKQTIPKANELISEVDSVLKNVRANTLTKVDGVLDGFGQCVNVTEKIINNCGQNVQNTNFLCNNITGIITNISRLQQEEISNIMRFIELLRQAVSKDSKGVQTI